MEYIVITHQTDSPLALDNFYKKVNERLQEGFKLSGSMQAIKIFDAPDSVVCTLVFYQPMIKE